MSQTRITNVIQMLAQAINEAGTATDVVQVANALEGMTFTDSLWSTDEMHMRPQDHQLVQDIHIFGHQPVEAPYDMDNSGYGLKVQFTVENASADIATTCEMKRP